LKNEDLTKKVERLEFYIHLLRDFSLDPEAFVLWDYIMTEELDREQAEQLMDILRKHKRLVCEADESQDIEPYWDALKVELKPLFESFKNPHPTDRDSILRVVRRASKLPEMYDLHKLLK